MKDHQQIRLLSDCSLCDAVAVWNKGFAGYFVDMTMPVDGFLARLYNEGLSPDLSVVAFDNDQPVGFLLSGIRMNGGVNTAWNGGTGVIPEFRGRGLGRILVSAALDLYQEKQATLAT